MRYFLLVLLLAYACDCYAYEYDVTNSAKGSQVVDSKKLKVEVLADALTDDPRIFHIKLKTAYELTCNGFIENFEHAIESSFKRADRDSLFLVSLVIGYTTDGATRAYGYSMTSAWNWLLTHKGKTVDCKVRYQSIAGFKSVGISVTIGGGLPITATFTDAHKNRISALKSDEIIMRGPFYAGGNGGGDSGSGDYSCAVQDGNCGDSPLIIDLAQNGIHFGEAGTGVWFDINNVGEPTPIQWVKINGDEAFLVRDLNNNGQIDDGGELFGTGTFMLQSAEIGQQDNERAANGFVALAQYDQVALGGNDDGYITAADAIWQQLALWRDSNADAFTDYDEIISLEQVGISHLEIIPKLSNRSDSVGNRMPFWSWVLDKNGEKHKRYKMVDVFFQRLSIP